MQRPSVRERSQYTFGCGSLQGKPPSGEGAFRGGKHAHVDHLEPSLVVKEKVFELEVPVRDVPSREEAECGSNHRHVDREGPLAEGPDRAQPREELAACKSEGWWWGANDGGDGMVMVGGKWGA